MKRAIEAAVPVASLTPLGVTNGASFESAAVAPGEIVTLFGSGLGPASLVTAQVVSGFPVSLAGTQVFFGTTPAPIVYTRADTVACTVPFNVNGQSTIDVHVVYNGQATPTVTVPVSTSAPAIFAADSSGGGQGAILNQDGSYNSASNPARAGQIVSIYGTGAGAITPAVLDGALISTPLPSFVLPVKVWIGGVEAVVQYAGPAPGLIAGALQINAYVPAGVSGNLPVVVQSGSSSGLGAVTVAVR